MNSLNVSKRCYRAKNRYFSFGSGRELPLPELIAVKPPLVFRFLKAAIAYGVQPTLNGPMTFRSAAAAF